MAKRKAAAKRSLSANLARSANKRGLTGDARERYIIGGAINAEKRHEAKLAGKKAASRMAKAKAKPQTASNRLELVVRKNAAASASRSYDVYSLYKPNAKEPYTSATYRKRAVAQQAAKTEMEMANHPKGVHGQNKF